MAVRSAFTALPIEQLGEPITDELAERFRQRLALTRYLVDVGLAATHVPPRRRRVTTTIAIAGASGLGVTLAPRRAAQDGVGR